MTENAVVNDESRFFTTSDGVCLHYRVAGRGVPLVVLPGFGQEASGYDDFIFGLKEKFVIYCLDYRWVGKSDSPKYGHHIERLAADVKEMTEKEGLRKFCLFAHSMGNAVSWCYFSIYGQDAVMKYVLGDEAPCLFVNPAWSDDEVGAYTGLFGDRSRQLFDFGFKLTPGPAAAEDKEGQSRSFAVREEMLKRLMAEHLARDWRDVIPRIRVPTMVVIAGRAHFASPLLVAWYGQNLQGARIEVITDADHNFYQSHPEATNNLLMDFFLKK